MANKNVVLMLLFGLTVYFSGCADSAPSSTGTDSAANGTFEAERTPVRESRSWGEFDIQLSYNIIPNEADTSNTHISDITVSVTDKEGIISECNVINPALSAAPGNSYFPSDLSIELELMDFARIMLYKPFIPMTARVVFSPCYRLRPNLKRIRKQTASCLRTRTAKNIVSPSTAATQSISHLKQYDKKHR